MPSRRISSALALAAATFVVVAAPAAAAPPPNDTIATATPITAFPFKDAGIAITEAGTEPFDTELIEACTEGAAEHSVWYRYTATQEGILDVTATSKGKWDATVAFSPGVPVDGDSFTTCGTTNSYIEVEPGQTYYIAVYAREAGVATKTLDVSASFYPKSVFMTIDSVSLTAGGNLAVSGTYTCSTRRPFGFVAVGVAPDTPNESYVELEGVTCTGAPQPYSVELAPAKGRWRGTVAVEAFAFVCGAIACEEEVAETTFAVPR